MIEKRCTQCGQTKPLRAFNIDRNCKVGIRAQCQVCQYSIQSKRYYREKFKPQAKEKARQAYKNGLIQKPLFCEKCHEKKPLDKHHPDYNKPLEVMWLCRSCHKVAS